MCNLDHVLAIFKCLPNLAFISAMHNHLNKAQKVDLKATLKRLQVHSQIFDYDATRVTPLECHDDDADDCAAFNIFHQKN